VSFGTWAGGVSDVRTIYSDPETFELRCPGCGYSLTDLARIADACPECGKPLPANWRSLEARALSAEGRRRVAIGLFLFMPVLWSPPLVLLAFVDAAGLMAILAGVALGLQFGAATLAAWPTRAGYGTGSVLLALTKAMLAALALAGVCIAAMFLASSLWNR